MIWNRIKRFAAGFKDNPQGVVYMVAGVESGEQAVADYEAAMTDYEAGTGEWADLGMHLAAQVPPEHPDFEKWIGMELPSMPELKQHIQGYVVFRKPTAYKDVDRILGTAGAHYEVAKGNHQQAADYCKKEAASGDLLEVGKLPGGSGHRTDLEEIHRKIRDGGRMFDIANEHFGTWVHNHRAFAKFQELVRMNLDERKEAPKVFTFWGAAGTGKTRKVYEESPNVYAVPVSSNDSIWFDGYDGHSDVLFDDFYGGIKFSKMLKLLDRYPLQVPIKGGYVPFRPKRIYITSNTDPRDWYKNVPAESLAGLRRRLTENGSKITKFSRGAGVE